MKRFLKKMKWVVECWSGPTLGYIGATYAVRNKIGESRPALWLCFLFVFSIMYWAAMNNSRNVNWSIDHDNH